MDTSNQILREILSLQQEMLAELKAIRRHLDGAASQAPMAVIQPGQHVQPGQQVQSGQPGVTAQGLQPVDLNPVGDLAARLMEQNRNRQRAEQQGPRRR